MLSKKMNYEALVKFVQQHFTDGLALVVGSGLSSAEGIPGMPELAAHLTTCSNSLAGPDLAVWSKVRVNLTGGEDLETALLKHPPTQELELWIARETAQLLLPRERAVVSEVLKGQRTLRLTAFLDKVLKPRAGLPILTTNYDRLIEVACEMAGFHVDTTAIGQYAGAFEPTRSYMAACKGITTRAKIPQLDFFPRAIVLKPHGSLDWYRSGTDARRCNLDLDAERLMITPGFNKYRAGYDSPFDMQRDMANEYIRRASRLLVIGYGFNDDHLQTHLLKRISDGAPTLIMNRSLPPSVENLAKQSPHCVCISRRSALAGFLMVTRENRLEHDGQDLWDLGVLAKELLV
jgi:hypothetical protein